MDALNWVSFAPSTNVREAAYEQSPKTIHVRYHGAVDEYWYLDCEADVWDRFVKSHAIEEIDQHHYEIRDRDGRLLDLWRPEPNDDLEAQLRSSLDQTTSPTWVDHGGSPLQNHWDNYPCTICNMQPKPRSPADRNEELAQVETELADAYWKLADAQIEISDKSVTISRLSTALDDANLAIRRLTLERDNARAARKQGRLFRRKPERE